MAADGLLNLYTEQFSTTLMLRLQQMTSKLRGKVMEGPHVGKMASPVQYVNPIEMRAPAGRFAPLNRTDTDYSRRWVFPVPKEAAYIVDQFDQLQTLIDPKNQLVEAAAASVGRVWDDQIIASAFAPAQIGQDDGSLTSESFNTSLYQIVDTFGSATTTSLGMTINKLIEARRIFRHWEVDLDKDPATLVIGSNQEADMLKLSQVVSTEYNDRPVLVDGRLVRFLGFDVIVSERLNSVVAASTATVRNCIVFVKSGLYLGMWRDQTNRVSIREDLSSQPYQIYTQVMSGATRLEPGRVLQIQCNDSTGGDPTAP